MALLFQAQPTIVSPKVEQLATDLGRVVEQARLSDPSLTDHEIQQALHRVSAHVGPGASRLTVVAMILVSVLMLSLGIWILL